MYESCWFCNDIAELKARIPVACIFCGDNSNWMASEIWVCRRCSLLTKEIPTFSPGHLANENL